MTFSQRYNFYKKVKDGARTTSILSKAVVYAMHKKKNFHMFLLDWFFLMKERMNTVAEKSDAHKTVAGCTNFEVFGAHLLELLKDDKNKCELAFLLSFVEKWAHEYDRGEKVHVDDRCNTMHLLGMALCVLLHDCEELKNFQYDLRAALGPASPRIMLNNKDLADHDIQEVQGLVTCLQLELSTLYKLIENNKACENGYWSVINTEDIILHIMAHLGGLLACQERKSTKATVVEKTEEVSLLAMHGFIDIDAAGFSTVRVETTVFLLDALHSIYSLHLLLTRAQFVCGSSQPLQELVPLCAHHREASNETFFTLSITADCAVGSIVQYAHRFSHLFHSVSQAIYYNHPTYTRQTQLSLSELERANTKHVNLLPLLTELRPDIPVLFEHTGAGCLSVHAKHTWSWVMWSNFLLLVDSQMKSYVAADARSLVLVAE